MLYPKTDIGIAFIFTMKYIRALFKHHHVEARMSGSLLEERGDG